MLKRMWLLLNKWKKWYRKENEYETTEQNADGGIDQSVQGQANTRQDAIRQTSTRQYSLSQHTSDTTGQSASGYGTTGQYGKEQGGKELVIWENNTVDEGSRLSALSLLAEQPVLHQNAMGLLTEQNPSKAQPDFEEEPGGVLIDVVAAENIAKKSKCTHTLDTNAIKEAILEAGTLEQFAQRKDAILGVMGRDARILATNDNSLGTNSSRKPETVGTTKQGTENEILESLAIVQVATEPNAMEPYSEGPSATNDIEQAAVVPQSTETSIISTLGLPVIRSSTTKLAIMEQTTIAQTATDPGDIEQTAIEQSVIRPFDTEPGAMAQPALEQGAIKPLNQSARNKLLPMI